MPTTGTTTSTTAKTSAKATPKSGTAATRKRTTKSASAKASTKRTATRKAAAPKRTAKPKVVELSAAERALLLPVGAALTAYERAASSVSELSLSRPTSDQVVARLRESQRRLDSDLTRYQQRGAQARSEAQGRIKGVRELVQGQLQGIGGPVPLPDPAKLAELVTARVGGVATATQRIVATAQEGIARIR